MFYNLYVRFMIWLGAAPPPGYEIYLSETERPQFLSHSAKKANSETELYSARDNQKPGKSSLMPFIFTIIGGIAGGIIGTVAMLIWYIVSGEFIGVMAGSGFVGLVMAIPMVSLILGGMPGGAIGGIIGLVLGIQLKQLTDESVQQNG
jgi:predicted phage tail protein